MAGGINLAKKYSREVDERWTIQSQVTLVTSNNKYKFNGVKTVVVYSIPTAPLNDYVRSGSNRYGTPEDLTRNIQELTVTQDKAFTFVLDKGDEIQSEGVSNPGTALAQQIEAVVVPAYDRYCFGVMAQYAKDNLHYASTAITASNAYECLMNGIEHMCNLQVPSNGIFCFCTYNFSNLLMQDGNFIKEGNLSQEMVKRGFVGNCGGAEIIRVAPVRLPQGAAFLLVHKDAIVAPKQVEEYKIHSDAVGYSGDVVEGRIIYDCFVLNEKAAGVYYHGGQGVVGMADVRSSATAAGKSTLTVNKNKDASTNKWYYYCAAKMSQLPTVTYGTAIDTSSTGSWYGATELTAVSTEITPSAGQTCFAFVETDSSKKPLYYATEKLHIG